MPAGVGVKEALGVVRARELCWPPALYTDQLFETTL
jgi:hypothetical protein